MKRIRTYLLLGGVLALGCMTLPVRGAPPADPPTPFWKSPDMQGDPLLFIRAEGRELATACLLFTPTAAPRLSSATGEAAYEIGKDFTWIAGSREISLTKNSHIPFKTAVQMHPAPGSPQSMENGKTALFWSEGHVFHDMQVVASYGHADTWNGPVPGSAARHLPKTLARLKAKKPLTVVALGDSITFGYNSSELIRAKPLQPAYPQLFATGLRNRYLSDVKLVNLAIAGKASAWGLTMAPKVAAEHPDLVIIAFGMNETAAPAAGFANNIRATMEAIRRTCPEAEFMLVAGMAGNPEWTKLRAGAFPEFRDSLKTLCGEGVALADVTSVWLELCKRKTFPDLTGNGLNHPNDFGHRVYAQVLLALFAE